MELLIFELIWWAGLFLFIWALRDARGRLASELESMALVGDPRTQGVARRTGFERAHKLNEPIGSYQELPIHRYAEANGRTYEFNRVCPLESAASVDRDELYLAPGLVYQESTGR